MLARGRIAWSHLYAASALRFGIGPVPVIENMNCRQSVLRGRNIFVKFQRLERAGFGFGKEIDDARLAELAKAVSAVLGRSGESPAINAAAAASASEPRPAAGTWPSGLPSEAWLAGLKQNLAEHLGPLASVEVDRERRGAKSAED